MLNKSLFSSSTCEWSTPQDLFDLLNYEFHFNLDPCSTDQNAKCFYHYTLADDGLSKSWDGYRVFCNPPYGRSIYKWIKKAFETKGLIVMLIPARTDTSWFHDYIYNNPLCEIRFIRGRIKFSGCSNSAPFPSMIVIFRNI